MRRNILFLYVEGDDDERLLRRSMSSHFAKKYASVRIRKYQQEKPSEINDEIQSIKQMEADYIFVVDCDAAPCVTSKRNDVKTEYPNVDMERIAVVKKEIESWYLAGLDDTACRQLGVDPFGPTTDGIGKKQFKNLIPKEFDSKIDFMQDILEHYYSEQTARQKNSSLKHFLEKHDC